MIDEIRQDFWVLFVLEALILIFGYLFIWLKNQFLTFFPIRDIFQPEWTPLHILYNVIVISTNVVDSFINTLGGNIATAMTLQGEFWTLFLIYVWIQNRPDEDQAIPQDWDFVQKAIYWFFALLSPDDFELRDFNNIKSLLKPLVLLVLMPVTQGIVWFFQSYFWAGFGTTMENMRTLDLSELGL